MINLSYDYQNNRTLIMCFNILEMYVFLNFFKINKMIIFNLFYLIFPYFDMPVKNKIQNRFHVFGFCYCFNR